MRWATSGREMVRPWGAEMRFIAVRYVPLRGPSGQSRRPDRGPVQAAVAQQILYGGEVDVTRVRRRSSERRVPSRRLQPTGGR
jgi:hypothetical protein